MTFLDFVTAVRRQVFPQGEAPNLKAVHKNWIKDALIELQQRVFCLQAKQYDFLIQSATFWNCGATVFCAPRGFIEGLKTVSVGNQCDEVRYTPTTKAEMECLMKEAESDSCACPSTNEEPYGYCGYYDEYEYLLGMRYANSSIDENCRARSGVFALHDGFIWMYPAMRSDEVAILDWRGIKRDWNDIDVLSSYYDREVSRATEYFLEMESYRKEDCDLQKFTLAKRVYDDKVGDLIWQCRKERRLPSPPPCFMNCEVFHRCSGRPVAADSIECLPGKFSYYYGEGDPNGTQAAAAGSYYVQVTSAGAAYLWKNTDGTINGWI